MNAHQRRKVFRTVLRTFARTMDVSPRSGVVRAPRGLNLDALLRDYDTQNRVHGVSVDTRLLAGERHVSLQYAPHTFSSGVQFNGTDKLSAPILMNAGDSVRAILRACERHPGGVALELLASGYDGCDPIFLASQVKVDHTEPVELTVVFRRPMRLTSLTAVCEVGRMMTTREWLSSVGRRELVGLATSRSRRSSDSILVRLRGTMRYVGDPNEPALPEGDWAALR